MCEYITAAKSISHSRHTRAQNIRSFMYIAIFGTSYLSVFFRKNMFGNPMVSLDNGRRRRRRALHVGFVSTGIRPTSRSGFHRRPAPRSCFDFAYALPAIMYKQRNLADLHQTGPYGCGLPSILDVFPTIHASQTNTPSPPSLQHTNIRLLNPPHIPHE